MATPDQTSPANGPQPAPKPHVLHGTVVPPSAGAAAAPAAGHSRQFPSMLELVHGFRRCWLRAVTVGALCALVAAAAAWFGMPLLSKAHVRTLLYVAPEQPSIAFPDSGSRLDYLGYKKTQATMIKSRMVLNAALRQPEVANLKVLKDQPDPADWLEANLVADYSTSPEILTVSLAGEDPTDLVPIIHAVTKVYLEEIVAKDHARRFDLLDKLKDIQSRYEDRLKAKRKTLRELAEAAGANDVANVALKQRIALEQLAASQKELLALQSEVRRLQVEAGLGTKEKPVEVKVSEAMLNDQIQKDPVVLADLAREARLQAQIDETKRVNPTRYEALTEQARADLDSIHKALEERRQKVRPILEAQLREQATNQAKARASQQDERLAYLQRLEKRLNEDVERLDGESKTLNKRGLDLESLRKEISQADDVVSRIGMQAETLNVERGAPARIRLIEEGVVSRPDQRARQMLAAGGAGVGALALVFLGLSWWECRTFRINSADEVTKSLGIKVMGTLPLLPSARRMESQREGGVNWQSLLLESVDMMRTALLHVARVEGLRVVMVTSAVGGEGKTSLSSHLATSLSRAGRNTLLIDCDLRKPSLHRVFELPRPEGVCEILRGELGAAEAIQSTPAAPGLSLIAGGRCEERALAALAQGGLAGVLAPLRDRYDFIILDSSPVLPVVDALLVAQEADGVLFSVLRDVSQAGRINAAHERLAMLGIRSLGAVVTGASGDLYYGANYRYLKKDGQAEDAAGTPEQPDEEVVEKKP